MFILSPTFSQSFKFGTPKIIYHDKEIHKGGTQIYDIGYGENHVYFTNNAGLMSFDGSNWDIFTTPNNTIMRSLAVSDNGRIYTGSQNELGYFQKTQNGLLNYVSLKDSLNKEDQEFSDVWFMETIGDTLYYYADSYVMLYHNGMTKKFGAGSRINKMGKVGKMIWFQAYGEQLRWIREGKEIQLLQTPAFLNKQVVSVLEAENNNFLILTDQDGFYKLDNNEISKWTTDIEPFLKNALPTSAIYNEEVGILVSSSYSGLALLDTNGQCKNLLNKNSGLKNNSINSITITPNQVLWVGSVNGINEIDLAINSRRFYPDNDLEGAVYDMDEWKGYKYFSTSNGLYRIKANDHGLPEELEFELVKGSLGHTWSTQIINDRLYCAHHTGPLRVNERGEAQLISNDIYGAWQFMPLKNNKVALGAYDGVYIFSLDKDEGLILDRKLKDFIESSRIMLYDNQENLWISHPYKFVYRVDFNEDLSAETIHTYTADNGFKTNNRNYVYNINDICYLANETGVYMYKSEVDSFVISPVLNQFFDGGNTVKNLEQKANHIWAISDQFTAKLDIVENGLSQEIKISNQLDINTNDTYIGGFEKLVQFDKGNLYICTESGMLEYALKQDDTNTPQIDIKSITIQGQSDSLLYRGRGLTKSYTLSAKNNNLFVEYGPKHPSSNLELDYQYRLVGDNNDWSYAGNQRSKDFNHLRAGKYTFEVKAISKDKQESNLVSFDFEVKAPWYLSKLAYSIYSLLALWGIFFLFRSQKKTYEKNTDILIKEKEQTKIEMEEIKREKLESEISFKNKELASSTLHLLQKNQTLNSVRTKISELQKQIDNQKTKKELSKIVSILRADFNLDEDWDKFSIHFDQVHQDFIKRLKSRYPQLTTNDHKLCAYLKMNLSTKEIAPLLNISIRGVEISRYRLRKKLDLDRSINLNEFFNSDMTVDAANQAASELENPA